MATTRIIPMHINKGKTIAQCMKARIDYVKNPDKTEDGEFISSYACAPESADQEFVLARNQYLMNAGSGKKNEVIAYQLRQSFKPGEVSAEEANKIGYELAERLLHGEHAFIVATHTDRRHVHNHIVFCATALDCSINSGMCGIPVVLLRRSEMSFAVSIIFRSFRFRRTKPFRMRNGRAINLN